MGEETQAYKMLLAAKEQFWFNLGYEAQAPLKETKEVSPLTIDSAAARFKRFESFLKEAFPGTNGQIQSSVRTLPSFVERQEAASGRLLAGRFLLKEDYALPVAGSIKARGGFHEVMEVAERLEAEGKGGELDQFELAVGSTGNLGLSIGLLGSALGFQVKVHMSADAKAWKKEKLRSHGVQVFEYESDYGAAVAAGRKECQVSPNCHFVDDEASASLFNGYAVAAREVEAQLKTEGVTVDSDHPLCVYLPCGVGGGPGGVAYGLKHIYGDAVHVFFAEPVQAPAAMLGWLTGEFAGTSVQDVGLSNVTEADGLAVGRVSPLVSDLLKDQLAGFFTVTDERLKRDLVTMYETEGLFLEPSALAGVRGPWDVEASGFFEKVGVSADQVTHLVWSTGGSIVPEDVQREYIEGKGER
ncbi:D-serine ammonia-lyase [Salsuginibacillus kocurii]|uniref:D-serine ammonia-lyase n=1 Tax=Salsuginibacillus kocurii TaxID=427078 RepID=UPI00037BF978|nr:D-serine ammonia-lyase [Salsuginibacillus kocurii]